MRARGISEMKISIVAVFSLQSTTLWNRVHGRPSKEEKAQRKPFQAMEDLSFNSTIIITLQISAI